MTKSTALRVQKNKEVSLGDRLTDLVGLTFEHITSTTVIEQCYYAAITIAS